MIFTVCSPGRRPITSAGQTALDEQHLQQVSIPPPSPPSPRFAPPGFLGFLLAVYMLWVIVLGLRSCGSLRRVSPSYVLLYCITLLACLVAVIGVFVAAYYPYSTSGVAFVGIHGLLNLYVWTLAISFSPVRSRSVSGGDSNALGVGDKSSAAGGTAVTGTRAGAVDDISGWEDSADGDFKAVEL